jgi:hypothetical protein
VQVLTNAIGGSYSTPAFWNKTLYYGAAKGDTLKAFSMSGGLISTNPPVKATTVFSGGFGATPVITANGTNQGIVWLIQNGSPAILHAYNATNITLELYNSSRNLTRDNPGNGVKFGVPAVVNGKAYVGTQNSLAVFGLLPPPVLTIALTGTSTALSWPTNTPTAYKLQSSSNLFPSTWVNVTNSVSNSSGLFRVTVPASGKATFYRLRL